MLNDIMISLIKSYYVPGDTKNKILQKMQESSHYIQSRQIKKDLDAVMNALAALSEDEFQKLL